MKSSLIYPKQRGFFFMAQMGMVVTVPSSLSWDLFHLPLRLLWNSSCGLCHAPAHSGEGCVLEITGDWWWCWGEKCWLIFCFWTNSFSDHYHYFQLIIVAKSSWHNSWHTSWHNRVSWSLRETKTFLIAAVFFGRWFVSVPQGVLFSDCSVKCFFLLYGFSIF